MILAGCVGLADPLGGDDWRFVDATDESGLDYDARASGIGNGNSGVYVTDFNNDGWPDVLAIGGPTPVLFENVGGQFRRADIIPELAMAIQGALFFDADGDGWEDLLLLPRDGTAVFLENDGGTFTRRENGLTIDFGVAVGASAADFDGDRDTDVFIIQYGNWANRTPKGYLHPEGGYVTDDNGGKNILFENTGDGFDRVTDAGIRGSHWSLATSFVDLTGDGNPDIHVANDFNHDTLYINTGDGSFNRVILGDATARNGMSSEVGDFNGDSRPDVFVTNIYFPLANTTISEEKRSRLRRYFAFVLRSKRIKGNTLLINQGQGSFTDSGPAYRVDGGGWGWAAVFTDLNNDMRNDLYHTTQTIIRFDEENPEFTYPQLWTRTDDGFEKRDSGDLGFAETNGRGVAELDYDRDGDVDLLVSTYDGAYHLYENRADELARRNSVQIRVVNANGLTTSVGATVRLTVNGVTKHATLNAMADYQSQDTRVLHFGLGEHTEVDRISVTWPDGKTQQISDVKANQLLLISPNGTARTVHRW